MKDFYVKLGEGAIVLILLIVFIFVLADCKMDNQKLRLKISLVQDENEKLIIETQEIRKTYFALLSRLIDDNKVSREEISSSLPAKEWSLFTSLQNKENIN